MNQPRGDNSWYPVYKRSWYTADIRLISLISGCWILSKHGCFQRFINFFFFLWIYVHWCLTNLGISRRHIFFHIYSAEMYEILDWSFVNFLWISVWYLQYPTDILISGVQISTDKLLPLGQKSFHTAVYISHVHVSQHNVAPKASMVPSDIFWSTGVNTVGLPVTYSIKKGNVPLRKDRTPNSTACIFYLFHCVIDMADRNQSFTFRRRITQSHPA